MQGIETEPVARPQTGRAYRGSLSGKKRRTAWLGIAAAVFALALGACAPRQAEDGPGTAASDPPATEEPAPDTEAPRLLGVKDITVALGGTISYRDGVSAVDDVDGTVPFQVDAGAVDLAVPGIYQVVYSAVDAAGNRAEAAASVTVEEPFTVEGGDVQEPDEPTPSSAGGGTASSGAGGGAASSQATEEEVNRLADQILGRIIRNGMSQREKARAIYNYVYNHIRYTGSSDKSSWIIGAYTGFTRQRGDCFNYFACSKALLTRAGIPNIDLERVGGNSRHYWQLVNAGDGWYHFDACPHPTGYPLVAFMITETQARTYTEQVRRARQNYYVYDYDACPVQVEGMPPEGWQPPAASTHAPPAVTQPPVTEPPEVTDPVETQDPPEVTDPPATEDPMVTDPAVTDSPEVTEPPVVTDPPEVTDTPMVTDAPVATDSPEVTQPPVEETDPPAQATEGPPLETPPQTDPAADSQQPGQPGGGE